jgi:hypothetical protein
MLRQMKCWICATVLLSALGCVDTATAAGSKLVTRVITAKSLAQTRIGVDPNRAMVVYLPAGYDRSAHRYPMRCIR